MKFADNLNGVFLAAFLLILFVTLFYRYVRTGRYGKQALVIVLFGAASRLFAMFFTMDIEIMAYIHIIGNILTTIGVVVGFYGKQLSIKSPVPMYVFIGSYLLLQAIGYVMDVKFLQSVTITGETIQYQAFGPALIIPTILTVGAAYKWK